MMIEEVEINPCRFCLKDVDQTRGLMIEIVLGIEENNCLFVWLIMWFDEMNWIVLDTCDWIYRMVVVVNVIVADFIVVSTIILIINWNERNKMTCRHNTRLK